MCSLYYALYLVFPSEWVLLTQSLLHLLASRISILKFSGFFSDVKWTILHNFVKLACLEAVFPKIAFFRDFINYRPGQIYRVSQKMHQIDNVISSKILNLMFSNFQRSVITAWNRISEFFMKLPQPIQILYKFIIR